MSSKNRLDLLKKIGQAGQIPANTTAGPTTVSGSPTKCDVITYFPGVIKAWGPGNLHFIQKIVDVLNEGIYVLSHGQMDFNTLRISQFNAGTTKYPDRVQTNIIKFSKEIYNYLLTDLGKPFAADELVPETKKTKIAHLAGALSTSGIPDSGINQFLQTKIGGSLKALILSQLNNIK